MGYNPCGRIVSFGRDGYTAPCRFFRDDGIVGTIKWYLNEPAPALGFPTRIRPLRTMKFPELQDGVGEVYGEPQPYLKTEAIPFLTFDHICGTRDDFALGGVFDPDAPPVQYTRQGLPVCCLPPFAAEGGAVGSGSADVQVVTPCAEYNATSYSTTWLGLVEQPPGNIWYSPLRPYAALTGPGYAGNPNWQWSVVLSPVYDSVYETTPDWDGHTNRTFNRISGTGPLTAQVYCVDPP